MDENKKRILYIIGFTIVSTLLGYAIYRVFFYKEPVSEITTGPSGIPTTDTELFPQAGEGTGIRPTTGQGTGQLPTAGTTGQPQATSPITTQQQTQNRQISQAVNTSILSPAKDSLGNAKFYDNIDGKFYRLNKNDELEVMSDKIFYNIEKTTWSNVDDKAIIEYPDGSNIFYDFKTQKQVTLPKHWEDFSFSPQGDQIAAKSIGLSPENRWLIASDNEGKNVKLIEGMGENADKVIVDWSPNNQVIAFSKTGEPLGADRQQILSIGLNHENFKGIIAEGRAFLPQWSPAGDKVLYSVYSARNNYNPELWVVNGSGDAIGSGRQFLNLNTWADKCTFNDNRFVYCAVPTELPNGTGFAPELADNISDKIFKIDLLSGVKIEIPLSDYNHTVDKIFTGNNNSLYFSDKNVSGLFKIKI